MFLPKFHVFFVLQSPCLLVTIHWFAGPLITFGYCVEEMNYISWAHVFFNLFRCLHPTISNKQQSLKNTEKLIIIFYYFFILILLFFLFFEALICKKPQKSNNNNNFYYYYYFDQNLWIEEFFRFFFSQLRVYD